ncbi:hypothetical protein QDR37_05185 [Amnibacterium sp. CER49]|uniref:hypothetical protein n=1 Tax=Amnibacterium sp. CER49 TaxID=3039161 RepID=UPI00244D2D00|nr:hypothetical protein [Amnibacterium sp. CER49]MDH2443334.1 hypothetical protein [Amnibacterium sp. CER49]
MELSGQAVTRLRSAAARVEITPPIGIALHNWGYSPYSTATGVHRPLFASLCAFDTNDGPALLVSLDLGWWMDSRDEALLRQALAAAANLPDERLIVALTHSHAGPSLSRSDADRPGGELIAPYLDGLGASLAGEVPGLLARLEPSILEWSYGRCGLAVNRDLYLADERRFVVGANLQGDADDTLLVGRLTAERSGETIAVLVNYAAHPTTLGGMNPLLSPDYPGAARELVEQETGGVFVFLQGASGDLSPRRQYESDPAVADQNGKVLGHAVLSTLAGMPQPGTRLEYRGTIESGAPLGIVDAVAADELNRCNFTRFHVTLATQHNDPPASGEPSVQADRELRAQRIKANAAGSDIDFPVTAWGLGPALVFAYPGEAYSSLQQSLRRTVPDRPVLVVNLANGAHQGYLPSREAYDQGRYPAWQSPLAAGSLERLEAACLDHLNHLSNNDESEQG